MWISLYVIQTLVGAVFYRKYFSSKGNFGESTEACLIISATIVVNWISLVFLLCYGVEYLFKQVVIFIDYLAGVKN